MWKYVSRTTYINFCNCLNYWHLCFSPPKNVLGEFVSWYHFFVYFWGNISTSVSDVFLTDAVHIWMQRNAVPFNKNPWIHKFNKCSRIVSYSHISSVFSPLKRKLVTLCHGLQPGCEIFHCDGHLQHGLFLPSDLPSHLISVHSARLVCFQGPQLRGRICLDMADWSW